MSGLRKGDFSLLSFYSTIRLTWTPIGSEMSVALLDQAGPAPEFLLGVRAHNLLRLLRHHVHLGGKLARRSKSSKRYANVGIFFLDDHDWCAHENSIATDSACDGSVPHRSESRIFIDYPTARTFNPGFTEPRISSNHTEEVQPWSLLFLQVSLLSASSDPSHDLSEGLRNSQSLKVPFKRQDIISAGKSKTKEIK